MKNNIKLSLLTAAAVTAITLSSSNVFSEETDSVVISFDHPQSISVSAPNNTVETASGGLIQTVWTITSNNAVGIAFSGKSASLTSAGGYNYPVFYKAEVDATGAVIPGRFDHLATTYGVEIAGYDSFAGSSNAWKSGATPTGTPIDLVTARETLNSPGKHFEAIMPSDDGLFDLKLFSQGIGDASTTQSGDYQITVTATITAEEQGDTTLDASNPTFL